ncbi:SDR family oxidoreductase [Caballeronia sordidicola]|jgi:NAD(P)-dependent dehydrogenase (short-subunit alcohol dehydrogenase family)|uniref:Short chain dehydrogenase n=1 Tax=Caballeronia sordidicola TaxID=196367 RepID=A0A226X6S6_CABSO|nr:SDR family oxidoreductase [Caballeronia sordidicola]OXC78849.1 short chain dehydrogenase [Caballeronia sordidicola]
MAQTWLITGSSSGFGRLLTEKLLARGDSVAATLRKVHALDGLKEQFGERLWVASLDVTDTPAIQQVTSRAFAEMGRIDVVVSNAGYGLVGAAEELSDEQIRQQIDTNLIGSIQVIRAVLPYLRRQGGGRILQVSSEGGQIVYPDFSLYHATKWGIEGFVEAVALEVASFGIEFTIVEPGPAKTSFSGGIVKSVPMAAYDNTPAGDVRRAIEAGSFVLKGDPDKMVQAMIDSVERTPAPMRLTLGSDAFDRVRAGLSKRLAELDAQKDVARSTELDDA